MGGIFNPPGVPLSRTLNAGSGIEINGGASANLNTDIEIAATGGSFTLIDQVNVAVATANINFPTIPDTFEDLMLTYRAICTGADANILARFNGDTTVVYNSQLWNHYGADAIGAASSAKVGSIASGILPSSGTITIPSYSRPLSKAIMGQNSWNGATDLFANIFAGQWNKALAIDEIDLFLSTGNFGVGTVITLYGLG